MTTDFTEVDSSRIEPIFIEIMLHQSQDGSVVFKNAMLRLPRGRVRVSALNDAKVPEAFEPVASEAVLQLCAKITSDNQVVSLPGLKIAFGFALGSTISVLSHKFNRGARQILITIRDFIGNPWSIFDSEFLAVNGLGSFETVRLDNAMSNMHEQLKDLRFHVRCALNGLPSSEHESKMLEISAMLDVHARMFGDMMAAVLIRPEMQMFPAMQSMPRSDGP